MSFEPKNVWFTADFHFGHGGILHPAHGSTRSDRWSLVHEMDIDLLEQWRTTVGPHDMVYHIGDLFFRVGVQKVTKLLHNLSGLHVVLLLGNHDGRILRKLAARKELPDNVHVVPDEEGFTAASHTVAGLPALMRHWPAEDWPGKKQGCVLLHGHSHGNARSLPGRLDVGWDVHRRLLHLDEVREHFETYRPCTLSK